MSSKSWFNRGFQLGMSSLLVLVGVIAGEGGDPTFAQVTADPSLGTEVTIKGNTLEITGGTTVGDTNLFHSFSNFSVKSAEVANFLNAANINNILVRVTGGNLSDIQGQLQAQAQANLFLINPNGILFRDNARLSIGGSFIGTTASAIQFPGGGEFSITSPVDLLNSLLLVNPSALLFNQIAVKPISSIQVNNSRVPLSVRNGQSLLLVGGNVNLEGGRLQARGGRIELGGLAGVGTVGLNVDSNNLHLSFPQGVQRADVSLSKGAIVTARDIDGGRSGIQVQGRRITLTDASEIRTINTSEAEPGGTLAVTASELVDISGRSRLLTDTVDSGSAGELRIETAQLIAKDGAEVSASTLSEGRGGTLSVTARDSIHLIGTSGDGESKSGLFVSARATGSAGNLEIKTGQLIVQDEARISASTSSESTGQGGNIIVETGKLGVLNGALVTVSSVGLGDAGSLTVNANSINLDQGKLTGTTASGKGGDISLQVRDLIFMRNGSAIATTSANNGSGGNIRINATFIVAVPSENSDILANAREGPGGRIEINATGIYGLLNRTQQLPDLIISEINASSESGIDGTVELNTPDIDPNSALINLPSVPVDTQMTQGCYAGSAQAQSEFIITGRGGLPPNPGDPLSTDAVQVDLVTLYPTNDNRKSPSVSSKPKTTTPKPIVEATGWVKNALGEVILTANPPTATPNGSWHNPVSCRTSG